MASKSRPILLIIEDDPHWASIFERTFHASYEIVKVENLREAELMIPEMHKRGIQLAIVDIRLSDNNPENKDGILALQTLSEKKVPSIATSAYYTPDIVRDAFILGQVRDFWFKGENYNIAQWRNDAQRIAKYTLDNQLTNSINNNALKPYFIALASFIIIFIVLTIVAGLSVIISPENVSVILGLGFLLTTVMMVTLALFIGKITGKQFFEIIKIVLLKKK